MTPYRLVGEWVDRVHLPLKMNLIPPSRSRGMDSVPVLHLFRVSACYFAAGDCIYNTLPNGHEARRDNGLSVPHQSFGSISGARASNASLRNVTSSPIRPVLPRSVGQQNES